MRDVTAALTPILLWEILGIESALPRRLAPSPAFTLPFQPPSSPMLSIPHHSIPRSSAFSAELFGEKDE